MYSADNILILSLVKLVPCDLGSVSPFLLTIMLLTLFQAEISFSSRELGSGSPLC